MSSGSMDYLYQKVQDAAFVEDTQLRRLFRKRLNQVAKALRAIEWNDSDDGESMEDAYIHKCLADIEESVYNESA